MVARHSRRRHSAPTLVSPSDAVAPHLARTLVLGAGGTGKTARLIEHLVQAGPATWPGTLVWTRTPAAARSFRRRLEDAARTRLPDWHGYGALPITTARAWAEDLHREGRYGLPRRTIWPEWLEREEIGRQCRAHAGAWSLDVDRASADVPQYHQAILQWAGTLALNGIDPATITSGCVRGQNLARVLCAVRDEKARRHALGLHDLFPQLLAALAAPNSDVAAAWVRAVHTLLIDDAQDLPVGAARAAVAWAHAGGGTLLAAADPASPTARFHGAIPEVSLRMLADGLAARTEDLSDDRTSPTIALARCLRGNAATAGNPPVVPQAVSVRTPDEVEEAYEIARRIRHAVYAARDAARPLRYADCAVVVQSLEPTGAYLADALAFYAIPFTRPSGAGLANAPVVRYALDYAAALPHADPEDDRVAATLLAHGLANLCNDANAAVAHAKLVLRERRRRDVRQPLAAVVGTASAELRGPLAPEDVERWLDRWRRLRAMWDQRAGLATIIGTLVQEQILPAVLRHATPSEPQRPEWRQLTQLLQLADGIDAADPTRPLRDRLDTLARVVRQEPELGGNDDGASELDAVRILTPYRARDAEYRWLALAGFTSGRWPPPFRRHLLHLDTAAGADEPLTLWAPDADTHEREWRQLAAMTLERCDGPVLFSVPGEDAEGGALDASPWLDELRGLVRETQPLVHRARPMPLDAALTPAELAAAVHALTAAGRAMPADAEEALLPVPQPSAARDASSVDLRGRHLSAHVLNAYLRCPRQCFYTALLRIGEEPDRARWSMRLGSIVHETLRRLHQRWPQWTADDAGRLEADARELLDEVWDAEGAADTFTNPVHERRMRARALEMLASYARWAAEADAGVMVLGAEIEFSMPLDGADLRGRIDRIDRLADGRLRVVDYKTGSGAIKQGKTAASRFVNVNDAPAGHWRPQDVQLPVYVMAGGHLDDIEGPIAATALYFVRTDAGEAPAAPTVVWDGCPETPGACFLLDQTQAAAACDTVRALAADVLRGHFPPEPAKATECGNCPAAFACERVLRADNGEGEP